MFTNLCRFSLPSGSMMVPSLPQILSSSVVTPLLDATNTVPHSSAAPRYRGQLRSISVCLPLQIYNATRVSNLYLVTKVKKKGFKLEM